MVEKKGKAKAGKPKKLKLEINRLGETYEVDAYENEKIQEVVKVMAKALDKPEANLYFISGGKILKNEDILQDLKIKGGSPLYLAIKPDNSDKRGTTGLLPPSDAGEHGKKLAEACETLIDEIPNQILTFLTSHDKIKPILEANPKLVKAIVNIPKVVKEFIIHPNTFPNEDTVKYPEYRDPQVQEAGAQIFQILANDEAFNQNQGSIHYVQLWNQSANIDEGKVMKIFGNPFWKKFLATPFVEEFLVNFLPNEGELFKPDDRRKILKSLVQNPKQGLEERAKLIKEYKSAGDSALGKRKNDDDNSGKDAVPKKSLKKEDGPSSPDPPSDASIEEKFKKELKLLDKMGFKDHQANVKALKDANDYDEAVELLLQRGH